MRVSWQELRRNRPRKMFVVHSLRLFVIITVISWLASDLRIQDWLRPGRWQNLQRFLGEIRPYPVQGSAWNWDAVGAWLGQMWQSAGAEGLLVTLALSVASISGAGLLGALLSLPAARVFSHSRPFLTPRASSRPGADLAWKMILLGARSLLVFLRSVPEYVWAFLLLSLLGPTFWPLILALVLHNTGILGKLGSEVVENTASTAPGALRASGAGRLSLVLAAVFPLTLPRYLLYFFYRWETCVREATVLGMLGVTSLGFLMVESRARNRYDELVFFVVLGAMLVLVGDLVSALVRRWVRAR